MKKLLQTISIFAIASTLFAQTETSNDDNTTAETPRQTEINDVVAKVNGNEIYVGDVIAIMAELPPQYLQQDPAALYGQIVEQLVSQELLASEATDSEAQEFYLRQANRAVKVNGVIEAYVDNGLSDEYIQSLYDEQIAGAPVEEEFSAAHILVETEEEAIAIQEEIEGGADFATVAQEKSTGPSGPNGGDLGWFGQGQMVPEFEAAVKELEVGSVSNPIQTQFGWHVIKLNDRREKAKPALEEVKPQLEEFGAQQLIEQKLEDIREGADIEFIEGIDPNVVFQKF